mgnify:CR=1 FL=1
MSWNSQHVFRTRTGRRIAVIVTVAGMAIPIIYVATFIGLFAYIHLLWYPTVKLEVDSDSLPNSSTAIDDSCWRVLGNRGFSRINAGSADVNVRFFRKVIGGSDMVHVEFKRCDYDEIATMEFHSDKALSHDELETLAARVTVQLLDIRDAMAD